MLRTFETIKRSSFYKPQLAVNFPSRSFSANASAEFEADAQQITFISEKINKTPLRGVMPQPSQSECWLIRHKVGFSSSRLGIIQARLGFCSRSAVSVGFSTLIFYWKVSIYCHNTGLLALLNIRFCRVWGSRTTYFSKNSIPLTKQP